MSSTATGEDPSFQGDGSNWTIAYVIVFLIPVIFLAIAVYSTWQDRRTAAAKAKNDLETGRAVKMDRYFHPWKYGEAEAAAGADAGGSSSNASGRNGANRSNLTIATIATASGAAGSTSRRNSNHHPRGLASSPRRGGNNVSNMAPVTPWFASPEQQRRVSVMTNPYRPSYYQPQQNRAQQQQQQNSQQHPPTQQSKLATAETYLPRPTTSISDEADTTMGRPSGEEEPSTWKDGSDLRYV
ncbi:hypothetical protein PG985_013453 [Apiospora marii]|uniref:Uncharacterized protein n=1 Tax=Apiospora marii TaxID=335849 RepID=A0ABR1R7S6_9PEZI